MQKRYAICNEKELQATRGHLTGEIFTQVEEMASTDTRKDAFFLYAIRGSYGSQKSPR